MIVMGAYIALVTFFAQYPLLEELPFFDHMPEVRRFYACGQYDEVVRLGKDMLASGVCSDRKTLEEIVRKSEKHTESVSGSSIRFLRGFISGKSDTAADAAGAIASDMLLYGDVRDMAVQGTLWAVGKENDPVLMAISGAGILFEVLPVLNYFPAVLKYLHRTGSLTKEFTAYVIGSIAKFKLHRKVERKLFTELSRLVGMAGIRRTSRIMKFVKTPDELSSALRLAKESPEKAHLAVKATHGKVLHFSDKVPAMRLMDAALRGNKGLLTLKRAKWLAAVKIVSSGRLGAFIRHGARNSGTFRKYAYSVAAFLYGGGTIIILCCILWKKSKKVAKTE